MAMPAIDPDQDMRRRSAWRIGVPPLVFLAVIVAAFLTRAYTGQPGPAGLVLSGGVGLIALWALYDGLGRAFGRPRYLGTGRGLDRVFGLIQAVTTAGIAIALLPNTIRLIEFAARLALP